MVFVSSFSLDITYCTCKKMQKCISINLVIKDNEKNLTERKKNMIKLLVNTRFKA